MIEVCLALAPFYPVDLEILLLGALFHDLGKVDEFVCQPAVEQTPAGGLIGHIVLGVMMFRKLLEPIGDVPPAWALEIEHLIVSHHGEKEFGSPEVPKTPEAMVLHIVDLLDSKLGIILQQLRDDATPGAFTDYVRVLGRTLYRGHEKPVV
jgi:3'-5' exoribonuclease